MAASDIDFSGAYTIVKKQSDCIGPLLKCFGIPWIKRKVVLSARQSEQLVHILDSKNRRDEKTQLDAPFIAITSKCSVHKLTTVCEIGAEKVSTVDCGDGSAVQIKAFMQDTSLVITSVPSDDSCAILSTVYTFINKEKSAVRKKITYFETAKSYAAGKAKCVCVLHLERVHHKKKA